MNLSREKSSSRLSEIHSPASFSLKRYVIEQKTMTEKRTPHFWQSLRWSIMLKFLAASLLTWFIGSQIGVIVEYRELVTQSPPEKIAAEIETYLPKISAFAEAKNLDALQLQMREIAEKLKIRQRRLARYFYHNIEQNVFVGKTYAEMVLLNRSGEVIDTFAADLGTIENNAQPNLSADEKALVNAAWQGENRMLRIDETNTNLLVFPLKNKNGEITGAFFVRERVPFVWWDAFAKSFYDFLNDLSDFWLAVAICGFLFGFLQAHQIAHRLDKIAVAVKSWGKGEFAARAPEKHFDELGGLSRLLNRMAKSLQEVFKIRQELAMSEERNRIARDLHDSVKQQVFGLALQIGAAKALLEAKPEAVGTRLDEAQNLVSQVQSELVNLIRELRPEPEEKLSAKLKSYVADWSRQNNIAAQVSFDKTAEFSPSVENTLFRIIQESLANIARHSRATRVSVESKKLNDEFYLTISDNGNGFDAAQTNEGFGLQTMRERAETLKNGTLKIESGRGKGTKIIISFEI